MGKTITTYSTTPTRTRKRALSPKEMYYRYFIQERITEVELWGWHVTLKDGRPPVSDSVHNEKFQDFAEPGYKYSVTGTLAPCQWGLHAYKYMRTAWMTYVPHSRRSAVNAQISRVVLTLNKGDLDGPHGSIMRSWVYDWCQGVSSNVKMCARHREVVWTASVPDVYANLHQMMPSLVPAPDKVQDYTAPADYALSEYFQPSYWPSAYTYWDSSAAIEHMDKWSAHEARARVLTINNAMTQAAFMASDLSYEDPEYPQWSQ